MIEFFHSVACIHPPYVSAGLLRRPLLRPYCAYMIVVWSVLGHPPPYVSAVLLKRPLDFEYVLHTINTS